jgi:hypothetical protein
MPYHSLKNSFTILILTLLPVLISCHYSAGVKKDLNTGLISTYKNMEPEKVFLIMNDEVLNHTDIPLGEKFMLINENVKGLKERDGKISIGCSLKITDQKGKIILEEKDLFEGKDLFKPEDASMLKCTVTTGDPMKWEEKYDIHVIFRDKYSDGKIENKVTIRAIDIP